MRVVQASANVTQRTLLLAYGLTLEYHISARFGSACRLPVCYLHSRFLNRFLPNFCLLYQRAAVGFQSTLLTYFLRWHLANASAFPFSFSPDRWSNLFSSIYCLFLLPRQKLLIFHGRLQRNILSFCYRIYRFGDILRVIFLFIFFIVIAHQHKHASPEATRRKYPFGDWCNCGDIKRFEIPQIPTFPPKRHLYAKMKMSNSWSSLRQDKLKKSTDHLHESGIGKSNDDVSSCLPRPLEAENTSSDVWDYHRQ